MQLTDTYSPEQINAVARIKCQKSLLTFYKYFFKQQYGKKAVISDHHITIIDALERIYRGELKRLIINIAPRYNKTELAVKMFIAAGLAINPASKFIHASYADTLALDNSEAIKDLIQSQGYQNLFPEVQIKKGTTAKDKWHTTAGGGILARAAGGQITGFGAGQTDDPDLEEFIKGENVFSGAIIIDDPIKPDDADSETIRERINERFDNTIRNRVNSRNTPIIVIMQRLHPRDLSGYLMRDDEQDDWEVISLPCIKEDGEALWPFKHTLEELLKMKQANDVVFERQYMQNPAPKAGLLFAASDLNYFTDTDLSNPEHNYICADPANEGGDDFGALDTRLIGDKIYIHSVIYNTNGTDHNEKALVELVKESKCNNVGVEGVMGWVQTATRVREELEERGYKGDFRVLRPRTGKHTRITNRASFIRNNFVFRKDWELYPEYAKFMRVLTTYLKIQEPGRKNKHDDAPDICEMAAAYYEVNFPHLWGIK